jgi:hypothetical protein
LKLSFVESGLLTAFFATSQNVVDGAAGVWSQRLSVFLIPPVLLLVLLSTRLRAGPSPRLSKGPALSLSKGRSLFAGLSGLLAALLFTQDFYTAQFALFFAAAILLVLMFAEHGTAWREILGHWWAGARPPARLALVAFVLAAAWTLALRTVGGGSVELSGLRITSRDWRRPALVALLSLLVLFAASRPRRAGATLRRLRAATLLPYAAGAAIGCGTFLWIYVPAFLEHRAFSEDQLLGALTFRDPAEWRTPLDVWRSLTAYETRRTFLLVFAIGILAWIPFFKVDTKARLVFTAFALLSVVVLAVPLRLGSFSIWMAVFEPLPGFSVVRDPKRIVYVYELAAVLVTAWFLARLPPAASGRLVLVALLVSFLLIERNGVVFDFFRANSDYDRWVSAPIHVDPACQSFFIGRASPEYMQRSPDTWTLYAIDSMFIALNTSVPTLNGYSAWAPHEWRLSRPDRSGYGEGAREWIGRHDLAGVCQLDIDARVMRPYRPAAD